MRLIDADTLIEKCGDWYVEEGPEEGFIGTLKSLIDEQPTIQPDAPRVMTLEEVNALDWDYCYLEQERLPGMEYRVMLGKYIMTCVTWPSITASKITYGAENYGKTWRCWTTRPTDEQRKAAKWDDA